MSDDMRRAQYVCVAKCPENDFDGSRHCVHEVSTDTDVQELLNRECPCGNDPDWREVAWI